MPPIPTAAPQPAGTPRWARRLIMVAVEKGGVGKSFFMVNLAGWMNRRRQPFVAFDPDYCNSTFTRFVPSARFLDISQALNLDQIIEAFDETATVLVDGVGSQQKVFLDWMDETNLLDYKAEMNLAVTLVLIVEEDKDTVFQAGEAARRFGTKVDWLVVRNLKTYPTTRIYDNSKARKELLRLHASEITLHKMPAHLAAHLQAETLTTATALGARETPLIDRQRLVKFERDLDSQLDSVKQVLLP